MLSTTGLSSSRLGTVLASAAMIDDVIGLVLVQVIVNLGSSSPLDPVRVVRPIVVAIACVVVILVACRFLALPIGKKIESEGLQLPAAVQKAVWAYHFHFVAHTVALLGLVAGAQYAGTSALFAAYLAGQMINWWSTEMAEQKTSQEVRPNIRSDFVIEAKDVPPDKGDVLDQRNTPGGLDQSEEIQQHLQKARHEQDLGMREGNKA